MLMLPGLMPTRGLVHEVFRKCKQLSTDPWRAEINVRYYVSQWSKNEVVRFLE